MAVGTTWVLRNATTTNTCGHSYQLNILPEPDEESYTDSRYFNSHDTTGWDGSTQTDYQGVTADGTITRNDTIAFGDPFTPQT